MSQVLKIPQNIFTGYAATLIATIIWSGNFIASRALADKIPPCQLNFWRWLVAFIVILPFALPHLRQDWQIFKTSPAYFCLMSFVGVTLMNIFVYTAGQTTSSLNMALIMPATPVVILILAKAIYKTQVGCYRLLGMIIAFSGIIYLVCKGSLDTLAKLDFTSGDLWTIAGMLSFAVFSIFQKNRPENISSVGFNTIIFGLGLLFCVPLALWELMTLPAPEFSGEIAAGVLYSGIGCSTLSFWLWTIGIDKIGPVAAGIVYYSLPIYTAIMANFLLGESVTAPQLVGGGLIICGIIIASLPARRKTN